jgi:hypothetical protein
VLSVLRCTASEYPFGIFLLLAIVLSVLLRYTDSDYPFGIFILLAIVLSVLLCEATVWSLTRKNKAKSRREEEHIWYPYVCRPSVVSWRIWQTQQYSAVCNHTCVIMIPVEWRKILVCSSSIYGFWLPLWYLHTFGHCVVCSSSIYGLWLPLWYLRYTDSDCPFGILDIRIKRTNNDLQDIHIKLKIE